MWGKPEIAQETQDRYHAVMLENPHVRIMAQAGYSDRAIILHLCNMLEIKEKMLWEAEMKRPHPPIHVTVSPERMSEIKGRYKKGESESKEEEAKPTDSGSQG